MEKHSKNNPGRYRLAITAIFLVAVMISYIGIVDTSMAFKPRATENKIGKFQVDESFRLLLAEPHRCPLGTSHINC